MLNAPHTLADQIDERLSDEKNQHSASAIRDIVDTCVQMLGRGYAEDDPESVTYRSGYVHILTRLHDLYAGEQPGA